MRKPKQQPQTKTRLTLDLTPAQLERLEKLEQRAGSTKAGVVRDALRLYDYISNRTVQGYSFQAVDPKGRAETVFFAVE